ncbi:hypothetical protein [Actinophytocola sp.]|uniref:hypothetical protein n=1 Tax=Actinophytocola sp. TaxID=1872138 RepID=UPI002D7FCFD7|nr:hypothetical protein [Actinophytocola sp.]HET9138415.1 hypothetical protein [Actinophytocola sp.]
MSGDRSIAELGLTADLRTEPWHYPGPFLPFSCLQVGDRLTPLETGPDVVRELRRAGVDPRACRFVLGLGSNANPDVLRRKFERRGVSTTIPHVLGSLAGIALGYSAHVSLVGFVPASPYPEPDSRARVVVSVLTEEQLGCLDATEPNYHRIAASSSDLRLPFAMELPAEVYYYESKWGVLAGGDGSPLPFGTQQTVFAELAAWGLLPADPAERLTRELATRPELRERVSRALSRYRC